MNSLSRLVLTSLAALLVSSAALADQAGPPGNKPVQKAAEARKDAADKLKQKKAELKEKIGAAADAGAEAADAARGEVKEAAKEVKEARQEVAEAWAKLRETRKVRRQERRDEVKKKWGAVSEHPAVKAELKLHAWRMARLNRIRTIAKAEGKTEVVARADKLIEKEKARHEKHMEALKNKGGAQ